MARSKAGREAAVDATPPVGDASRHDNKEANRTSAAVPADGGSADGALEAAAAAVVASSGAGGSLGTLAATARQERQLREWAEKTGRLISEEAWRQHRLICASTAEHEVRHRAADNRAIKRTHLGTFGFIPRQEGGLWKQSPATPAEYLLRWILQNRLFDDDIRLEGFIVSTGPSLIIGRPAGGISLVISQSWLEALDPQSPHPTVAEIAALMGDLGFKPIPNAFYGWQSADENFVVLDAKPDNFIVAATDILPIDLQLACQSDFSFAPKRKVPKTQQADEARAVWRCPNPDCPAQVRAQLEHWCAPGAMDIEGGGEALIAQLVRRRLVRDVAELYQLTEGDLFQLEGMDGKSARNFLAVLEASKSGDLWRLLYGLGIPHVGAGEAQALARNFKSLDDVACALPGQLSAVENVGDETARSVVKWFKDSQNRKLVERLRKAGLNFHSSP